MNIQQNSPNENVQANAASQRTQTAASTRKPGLPAISTKEGKKGAVQTKQTLHTAKQSVVKSKNTHQTKEDPAQQVITADYNIVYQGGKFSIELCNSEIEGEKTKELNKSYDAIRKDIASKYNWNAIVGMMKFCAQNDSDFTYKIPTNLSGTEQDNKLIMPDAGMMSIVKLQLENALTNAKDGTKVLKKVDAEPGNYFATKIMSESSKEALMNEEDNHHMKDEHGQQIQAPNMNASPQVLYKSLRALVHARNGLWSDQANITNMVGIRRKLDKDVTKYNDSLIVCWIDVKGTKHAKVYAATTEPGEISNHRQMTAQTLTMEPGYHSSRQPAGRTSQFLARNKNNSETLKFSGDSGFNFHHGGDGQVNIKGMKGGGLSDSNTAKTEDEFAVNMLYVQAFTILTRWGKKQGKKAYDHLKEMKEVALYKFQEMKDGNISLKRDSDEKAVTKEIAPLKAYLAKAGAKDDKGREKFVRIIQSVDGQFQKPENLAKLKEADLKKLITDEHIKGILEKQMDYFADITDIDGKPGSSYINILDGKMDKLTERKAAAEKDYPAIEAIFKELKETYKIKESRINYLKGLMPGTQNERNLYNKAGKNADQSTKIDQNVVGWSEGCQVVFGPEKFYEFWSDVTDKATTSGQRRWYYTLIDEESFKTTTEQGSEG